MEDMKYRTATQVETLQRVPIAPEMGIMKRGLRRAYESLFLLDYEQREAREAEAYQPVAAPKFPFRNLRLLVPPETNGQKWNTLNKTVERAYEEAEQAISPEEAKMRRVQRNFVARAAHIIAEGDPSVPLQEFGDGAEMLGLNPSEAFNEAVLMSVAIRRSLEDQ